MSEPRKVISFACNEEEWLTLINCAMLGAAMVMKVRPDRLQRVWNLASFNMESLGLARYHLLVERIQRGGAAAFPQIQNEVNIIIPEDIISEY